MIALSRRSGSEGRRHLAKLLAALFLSGLALATARAQGGPPTEGTVAAMEFRGLETVDSTDVATRIAFEVGDSYTSKKLAQSIRDLYALRVFSMISAQVLPVTPGGVRVIWNFSERPRVMAVLFQGYKHLGEADLREKVTLRAGKLLSRRDLNKDRRAIQAAYQEDGYPQADVRPEIEEREDGVAVVFRIDEGKRAKIRKITFEGNEAIADDTLRGKLNLKKKSLFRKGRFSKEKLEEDKQRIVKFYANEGYKDAEVPDADVVFKKGGEDIELTFHVREGPLYLFGAPAWEGATVFTEEQLQLVTAVREGEPFSQEKIDDTLAEVYSLYTEQGYLLGLYIDPEMQTRQDTVDVVFQVNEGEPSKVREVRVRGNTRTREYVIRRELALATGDLLRRSTLMRSQRDVMALGFFEEVLPDYRPVGDGTTDIDVIFNVKERTTGTASAGAGFSSDTGVTGFVDLGHPNLFGRGQSVQIHVERGARRQDYRFSFTEPWLFGRPTSLGADIFSTQRVLDLYTEDRRGGGIRLGRPWFFRWPDFSRIFFAYTLENISFSDLEDLDEGSRDFLLSGSGTISQVGVTFLRSSTDNPFYPTLGSVTRWRTEFAGGPFGGDLDYVKSTLDLRQYFVPFWKPTVMFRFKLGQLSALGSSDVPGNETFRLGGTTFEHLRGYDDFYVVPEENIRIGDDGDEIRFPGGRFMFTFTAEYQFPIVNPLHGLLFFDAGNTWNAIDDFNLLGLKKGLGVGVRLEIPMLGQVGLDYAYGVERGKYRTHLILGPSF